MATPIFQMSDISSEKGEEDGYDWIQQNEYEGDEGNGQNEHKGDGQNEHEGDGQNEYEGDGQNEHEGDGQNEYEGNGQNEHEGDGQNEHEGDGQNEYEGDRADRQTEVNNEETNLQSNTNSKRSWIWGHFTNDKVAKKVRCNHCKILISSNRGSTSGMASHLKSRHKILKNQQTVQGKRQLTLQESVNMIPTIVSLIIFIISFILILNLNYI
jgi:BED zinc finger